MADDAGALLVRSGLVSSSALEDARSRVESQGGTLGEQLVAAGAIADDALTDFYRQRLLVPQVNPNTLARLSPKVIATIPGEMAIDLRAIPVSLDGDNNLTVAMSDPSDRHAVDEISVFTGAYVVRAVATQMQIAWCLAHYYSHVTALGARLIQPSRPLGARPLGAQPLGASGPVTRPRVKLAEKAAAEAPAPAAAPTVDGVPDTPRARSVSGEIRAAATRVRAASIKPPMPDPHGDDDEDDEPLISVEVSGGGGGDGEDDDEPVISIAEGTDDVSTAPRMLPVRRRVKSDPPELAARAGEVSLAARPERKVDDQPRIIIAEDQLVQEDFAPGPVSGELRAVPHRDQAAIPSTTIEVDDTSVGVVIHDYASAESEPVLLDRRRTGVPQVAMRAPPSEDGLDTTDDEVVVLEARKKAPTPHAEKRPEKRPGKRTQVGVGVRAAATRAHRDTDASAVPALLDDAPTAARRVVTDDGPTRVDARAAPELADDTEETIAPPPGSAGEDTSPRIAAPPPGMRRRASSAQRRPVPAHAAHAQAGDDDDDDGLLGDKATNVMSAAELDEMIPQRRDDVLPAHLERRHADYDPVDDGWGPPGTTIPPPLLGALPGIDEDADDEDRGAIPMPNVNTAPLIVAPPSPPESARGTPAISDTSGPSLVRALEVATSRAVQLIHALERAKDRDGVITLMIAHLGETHMRAGFFAIRPSTEAGKAGELAVWKIEPGPPTLPAATLRLDRPSTLQDVVGTRLPYRGPMHDDASRTFLANVLGACPPEILLVPVTVRDRVVGVLFGEHRMRHTFDDQLALAARAAGMALERILLAKRS